MCMCMWTVGLVSREWGKATTQIVLVYFATVNVTGHEPVVALPPPPPSTKYNQLLTLFFSLDNKHADSKPWFFPTLSGRQSAMLKQCVL